MSRKPRYTDAHIKAPAKATAGTCPDCGQTNQCAIAAGRPAENCWCMTAKLDKAQIEKFIQEQHCLCATCGRAQVPSPT